MQRIDHLNQQVQQGTKKGWFHVTDNRTGKTHEVKVKESRESSYIVAKDFQKMKDKDGKVLRIYDPGYLNTINATSKICYIDGEKGVLEYRGIPIEQLCEKSTFLEVAFLLIHGVLPSKTQYAEWKQKIIRHTILHEDVQKMMQKFRYNAHPQGIFISTLAALSTFRPESNPALAGQDIYKDLRVRNKEIYRLIGQVVTIAANAYRCRIGREQNLPHPDMDYAENFIHMMDKLNDEYKPHPKLVRALDVLFIIHAEHEMNCSTAFVRHLASSGVDIYSAMAGASAALYGPKHGGANEQVVRMLEKIGNKNNIPQFIQDVKDKKALLMGFGHRVYKNYDPRAKIVKKIAYEVFEVTGKEPIIEIALELEKIALSDPYFVERKLYPNVDFYSGIIYRAMGFPTDMFVVLFTIPRVVGWLSHWVEFLNDSEKNIARPRQNYVGAPTREYESMHSRKQKQEFSMESVNSGLSKRRKIPPAINKL